MLSQTFTDVTILLLKKVITLLLAIKNLLILLVLQTFHEPLKGTF